MSKSNLPNGGYTLTHGSNYMLDGFQFDTEYNGGVLEKARLPEAKGLSSLPSGMIPPDGSQNSILPSDDVFGGPDLNMEELTREASQDLTIVDHEWLSQNLEEDLRGVRTKEDIYDTLEELGDPYYSNEENDSPSSLLELKEKWGNPLKLVPNENRDPSTKTKIEKKEKVENKDAFKRKLAYGQTLSETLKEASSDTLSLKQELLPEYGLNGRVYVKEADFPGLFNGRWDEVIKKRCATAMYIIPNSKDCVFDRFLGMEVVQKVPYSKAAKTLLPKLESYGVNIASNVSPKEKLKRAFIDLMEGRIKRDKTSSWHTYQQDTSELVSLDHARRQLEAHETQEMFVPSHEDVEQTKAQAKLAKVAQALVAQGFLESEVVEAVVDSSTSVEAKIERLRKLATAPKKVAQYDTYGKQVVLHNMTERGENPHQKFDSREQRNLKERNKLAHEKVARYLKANLLTIQEVEKATKGHTSPEDKVASVERLLQKKGKLKTSTYSGERDNFEMRASVEALSKLQANLLKNSEKMSRKATQEEAMLQVDRLIKAGLLSNQDLEEVVSKHASLEGRLSAIQSIVSRPLHVKKASGDKAHYGSQTTQEEALTYTDSDWAVAKEKVAKLVEAGLLTKAQVKKASKAKDPQEFVRKATALSSKPTQTYQGHETAHVLNSTKKASVKSETEVKVSTWLRQKMSEGSAGKELDQLIASRFSADVLVEHGSRIASLRAEHEGLSGYVYVDAPAYMTSGVEGCEKGALRHRANQLPTLLKTAKCGSCVFNTGGSCQKYAKQIIASANEIEGRDTYQKENIRLANANDSEQTAALFANNYNPDEFNLTASEQVSVSEAPSNEALGDVLFGGFEI
jgi:hypothetical protein